MIVDAHVHFWDPERGDRRSQALLGEPQGAGVGVYEV